MKILIAMNNRDFFKFEITEENYKSYILIDFNQVGTEIKELFNNYLNNLDMFFMYLSSYYKVDLY